MEGRKMGGMILVVLTLALTPVASVPSASGALPGGPELSYELSVEPENPQVGDSVRLRFAVGINGGGGLPQYTLLLNDGVLEGEVGPVTHSGPLPDVVEFNLDAVGAGVAEVRLRVNYEGAFSVEGQCCVYHFTIGESEVFRVPVVATSTGPTHRVTVRVGFGEGTCRSGDAGRTVELQPTGRTALSGANGIAVFDGVADGDYELRIVPPCMSGSCFPYMPLAVSGADQFVELCPPLCTPQVYIAPETGPPGTAVSVEGACQAIHSGGRSSLLFGPITMGAVTGETAGDFHSGFVVPWVPPGAYEVSAAHGTALFEVTGDYPGCDGDCNGDLEVRIGELTRAVGIALGATQASTCPVFRDGASVAQLVRAVRAALDGCAALVPSAPTPTPIELTNIRCETCCADCDTAECVAQCVGHERCDLVAEWSGVVSDAASGAPIVGARVIVNQRTAVTNDYGEYSLASVREEVCSGLDYLFEVTVIAPGYRTFTESFYRVPFTGPVERNLELARAS